MEDAVNAELDEVRNALDRYAQKRYDEGLNIDEKDSYRDLLARERRLLETQRALRERRYQLN